MHGTGNLSKRNNNSILVQAIIRLRTRYGGSVCRDIGYRLLYFLLMTPAVECENNNIRQRALDCHI